jgi:DNA invertase Pin-like site-specific DNA recombinase
MKAFAYLRTSSAANVGADKDSDKRQRAAIDAYAQANGVEIVGEFYDVAVSGADAIERRRGFMDMLTAIAGNGVRTIVVETANRFARDLMTQESGFAILKAQGITLIAADSPSAFLDDSPTATLIRQILGAVAQFEKAMLVAKLRVARERSGRTGGRKGASDEIVARVKALRDDGLTQRAIVAQLLADGVVSPYGKPYVLRSVQQMLE